MADDSVVPRRNSGYERQEMDGELILYFRDETRAVYINESAALVLQLCDGERSIAAIRGLVGESYPGGGASVAEDVSRAVDELASCGAIEIE